MNSSHQSILFWCAVLQAKVFNGAGLPDNTQLKPKAETALAGLKQDVASKAAAARAAEQKRSATQALQKAAAAQLDSARQELAKLQEEVGRGMRNAYQQVVALFQRTMLPACLGGQHESKAGKVAEEVAQGIRTCTSRCPCGANEEECPMLYICKVFALCKKLKTWLNAFRGDATNAEFFAGIDAAPHMWVHHALCDVHRSAVRSPCQSSCRRRRR